MSIETLPVLIKVPVQHEQFLRVVGLVMVSVLNHDLHVFSRINGNLSDLARVTLTEDDLMGLYPNLPVTILNAVIAQFANRQIGLLFVTGPNAVSVVTGLKGLDNDPDKCAPDTWRYQIGQILGVRRMILRGPDGKPCVTVFDNFIHAPKVGEVERDMKVFGHPFPK